MTDQGKDEATSKESLGARIRRARGYRSIGQAALARAIGVGKTTLSQIETGQREDPRCSTVRKIAEELKVNPGFLLGFSNRIQPEREKTTERETFGTRIRRARGYRNMDQIALAREIGLSTTSLSKIENGLTEDPRISFVRSIAVALSVNPGFLLGLSDRIEMESDLKPAEAA